MSGFTELTLSYYDENAEAFVRSTVDVEFSSTQNRFSALLAPGARILDFGCGSGRDTKHFLDAGFSVTAIDGSEALCEYARKLTGIPIRYERFQDLQDECAYDGIWACSSILHLPKDELADVFGRMVRALRPGGVIYTSFKYGEFEGLRDGRHFTDFTECSFKDFLASDLLPAEARCLMIEDLWITSDVRPGRGDQKWLNLLLRKPC